MGHRLNWISPAPTSTMILEEQMQSLGIAVSETQEMWEKSKPEQTKQIYDCDG